MDTITVIVDDRTLQILPFGRAGYRFWVAVDARLTTTEGQAFATREDAVNAIVEGYRPQNGERSDDL